MPYCQYCHNPNDQICLRRVTTKAAQFMRLFKGHQDIITYDNICLACIRTEVQVHAQRLHKKIVCDTKQIDIEDESNYRHNDATRYGHSSSVNKSNDILLRLEYVTRDTDVVKVIFAHGSRNTTLEIIIQHMITVLKLFKSCHDIVLTQLVTNETTIHNIQCSLSTALYQFNIREYAILCFNDYTKENIEKTGSPLKRISTPLLPITVQYLEANIYQDYSLPYDATVQCLFSAITKSFHLNNIDSSRLQLKITDSELNNNNATNKKLIDLDIGTKYQLLFLFIKPEKPIVNEKFPGISSQLSKPHTKSYIVINSSFLQQTLFIDLSKIFTLIGLKQKIIDQYIKESRKLLEVNDISLSLNGIVLDESDNSLPLPDLGINDKTELQADLIIRTNKSFTQPVLINEDNQSLIPSKDKSDRLEVNKCPLLIRTNPVGLYNLGNTCFLNSALQCLSHVTPLTSFFLNELSKTYMNDDHNSNQIDAYGEVTSAYAEFIRNMWESKSSKFSPNRLRDIIGGIAPRFSTNEQQDAQEFMVFLLNRMHNEMQNNKKDGNSIIKTLFYNTIQSTTTCLKCKKNPKITSNIISFLPISLIQQKRSFEIHFISCYGTSSTDDIAVSSNGSIKDLVQAFVQKKGLNNRRLRVPSKSDSVEEYPMTKLLCEIFEDKITICEEGYDSKASFHSSISRHEENLTLYQCIHQFSTPEILKKFWFCNDECKETRAVKQMQLCSLARVLIVQLKRFTDENGYMRKLDMYVDFPLNGLDSSKFYPDTNHCRSNVIYDLIAVSNHIGSAYGGHYTAYARQSVDEPWYLFNDSRVARLSDNDRIVSRDAYILVYLRREKDENNSEI